MARKVAMVGGAGVKGVGLMVGEGATLPVEEALPMRSKEKTKVATEAGAV